jgi:hypothetical protein
VSDREALLAMLDRAGLQHDIEESGGVAVGNYAYHEMSNPGRYNGYGGFYAHFDFDEAGQLVDVSVWE